MFRGKKIFIRDPHAGVRSIVGPQTFSGVQSFAAVALLGLPLISI